MQLMFVILEDEDDFGRPYFKLWCSVVSIWMWILILEDKD